ncbi:MAG: LysM peptidoglycan-binding domain-containing protein [Victivallaceae bacterium]
MNRSLIMSGMVAALGSMLLVGGCKTEVMGERGYIPAEKSPAPMAAAADETAAPAAAPTAAVNEAVTEDKPLPSLDEAVPKKAAAASSAKKVVASTSGSYVVKSGDTIGSIAKAHGIGYKTLLSANGMSEDDARKLKVGRKLVIPAKGATASMASTAAKAGKSTAAKSTAKPVAGAKTATPAAADGATYVVKSGDSIPKIAKQLGVKATELMAANHMDEAATRRLQIGQKLVIPGKAGAAAATTAAAPVQNDAALDAAASALAKAPSAPAAVDTAAPAAATSAAPAAATPAAATSAAPAVKAPAEQAVTGSSVPVEILEDIKLDDFVKNQKITIDIFKKMNPDVVTTDGVLKTNTVVFVPGAE